MFAGSSGSISETVCVATPVFSPKSKAELKRGVDACLKVSPKGDSSDGPHGPIGEWGVLRVTDMSNIFHDATLFNTDISKWEMFQA